MKKIIDNIKLINKVKFHPKIIKSDIVVYDNTGFSVLSKILSEYKLQPIHTRNEIFYFNFLIHAIFLSFFKKEKWNIIYFCQIIKKHEAKTVISTIDNDEKFYMLKNLLPEIFFISIQNGTRTDFFVHSEKKLMCDYLLIFGKIYEHYYKTQNIKSNYILIGSILNNHFTKEKNKLEKSIIYISQYRSNPKNEIIYFYHNSTPILYENFYFPEISIIRFIEKWAQKNNYSFHICGFLTDESDEEKLFFENILQEKSFTFHPKENLGSSYHLIDRASIVAFCDSTLGYESLRRGNKTAAFTCRSGSIGCEEYRFGWPGEFPNNGAFWTNEINENEFERILNYLHEIDPESWLDVVNNTLSDIISYDEDNSILKNYVNNLLKGDVELSDN